MQLVAQVLGHAAGNPQHDAPTVRPVLRLVLRQRARPAAHALYRPLAYGAGVDQDDVRARWIQRALVARLLQKPEHHFGVGDIHLAAVGFNVDRGIGLLIASEIKMGRRELGK